MKYHIAIGADNRGFQLKELLRQKSNFGKYTITWHDVGTFSPERTDYPLFAQRVAQAILDGEVDYGILMCGSGIGESIAANRYPRIYAGLVWNEQVARVAKEHDNVNVLIIPADYLTETLAYQCIETWLAATFNGGRYQKRLAMIDEIDQKKEER